MGGQYRSLSKSEIEQLEKQHCLCEGWSSVQVGNSFDASLINNARFHGRVRIGNNVKISSVHSYIANYEIGDNVIIENIGLLAVNGKSTFGNAARVVVINEGGGREVPIYDNLSAQLGAMLALYRNRMGFCEKLNGLIDDYARSVSSDMGMIGTGAVIKNSAMITNVKVGPAAKIDGALRLENGTINSSAEDPAFVGTGVCAANFITSSGSCLDSGAILQNCFVGQSAHIEKQFSAENCLFFSNCIAAGGEACAAFAGPYTSSHHKTTLLIAGLFSFFNAGAGTNQSNHLYKLGPLHQGICERGCKTGSNAYLVWPAKIGAFTIIVGSHYSHFDTSTMPFSYLIEEKGNTILVPGATIKSIGIIRDEHKWRQRDRRKDPNKLDLVIFDALSPYTVQNMISGRNQLANILTGLGESTPESVMWNNTSIKYTSISKAIHYYELALARFLGEKLICRIENAKWDDVGQLRQVLIPNISIGRGKWIDLAGLIIPEEAVHKIIKDVESGKISSLEGIYEPLNEFYKNYEDHEWRWAAAMLEDTLATNVEKMTPEDLIRILEEYRSGVEKLHNLMLDDARKEFDEAAKIGYGIDHEQTIRNADFEAVRGKFEENEFVRHLTKTGAEQILAAENLINRLESIAK